tara:strand:+ start:818 stop:1129 length:312 start_codon:yes stop_codon:yes gene_type:complete
MGKGSKQRPTDKSKFDSNYDAIFNKTEEKKMTQADRVLNYLQDGNTITTLNAFNELGITRLAARVHELKQDGHAVKKKTLTVTNRYDEKCSVAEYYLENSDAV